MNAGEIYLVFTEPLEQLGLDYLVTGSVASSQPALSVPRQSRRSPLSRGKWLLLALVTLVACGDDDASRQERAAPDPGHIERVDSLGGRLGDGGRPARSAGRSMKQATQSFAERYSLPGMLGTKLEVVRMELEEGGIAFRETTREEYEAHLRGLSPELLLRTPGFNHPHLDHSTRISVRWTPDQHRPAWAGYDLVLQCYFNFDDELAEVRLNRVWVP